LAIFIISLKQKPIYIITGYSVKSIVSFLVREKNPLNGVKISNYPSHH